MVSSDPPDCGSSYKKFDGTRPGNREINRIPKGDFEKACAEGGLRSAAEVMWFDLVSDIAINHDAAQRSESGAPGITTAGVKEWAVKVKALNCVCKKQSTPRLHNEHNHKRN